MKNALLPDFNRCSTQGKKRKSIDRHAPKQGRPSRVARLTGVSTGMNIDDTVKEYFRRGTKLFYENAEKMPMTQAFERILILFFHQGKELQNGVFVPMLPLNCLHSISIDAGTQRNMTPDIPSLHAKT